MHHLIRTRLTPVLSLALAAALQVMPLLRQFLPAAEPGLAPSAWAVVFQWTVGAVALFGYHAVSSASSITISPTNALQGVPYSGTITYSGNHAGSVKSWKGTVNWTNTGTGTCMAGYPIAPGLTALPNANNTCLVTGTPTNTGTFAFTMKIYSGTGCTSDSDTRSTSLTVTSSNAATYAPTWSVVPQAQVAQTGSNAAMSAVALGNPTPAYTWFKGLVQVGTTSTLSLNNIQFTNAGLYTVMAANSQGSITTNAYLTVVAGPPTSQQAPQLTGCTGAVAGLSFTALQGYRYLVLAATNMAPSTQWQVLTNLPPAASNYQFSFPDCVAGSNRYYRLLMTNQ